MSEKIFESSLSIEEIENNFKDINFFDGVIEGLEEALAYKEGTAKPETIARKHSLPDVNVSQIKNALSMTQKAFAHVSWCILQDSRSMGTWQKQSDTHSKKINVFDQPGPFADSKIISKQNY